MFSSNAFCDAFYLLCQAGADIDRLVDNLSSSEKVRTLSGKVSKSYAITALIETYNHCKKKNRITTDNVNNAKPKPRQYK